MANLTTETSSENNKSNSYDEIINLVAACGDHPGIPGELVVEILSKLPVKSLFGFKIVCKPWKLLVDCPLFIDKHLHRKNPQIGFYSLDTDDAEDDYTIDQSVIVGTCNGIICLENDGRLLLLNPSTKEFSFLPREWEDGDYFGFYYTPQTGKYHVISFYYKPPSYKNFDIRIRMLGKSTCFREVKDVIVPGKICRLSQITCGNSIYWLGYDDDYVEEAINVICYDLIEERFSKMDLPPSPSSSSSPVRYLGVYKDSVVMTVYSELEATSFDIWMLIDDVAKGKSWMRYRRVGPLNMNTHVHLNTYVSMTPVGVYLYGKKMFWSKGSKNDGEFCYNIETDQVEPYSPTEDFVYYVESLVPINGLVPCIDTDWYYETVRHSTTMDCYQLLAHVKI